MTQTNQDSGPEERARQAGCPVVDFDIEADPAFRTSLREQWLRARDLGPVFYSTAATGFWVLTGRDEISAALNDPESFSAQLMMAFSRRPVSDQHLIPMTLDPPVHTSYRRLLTPMFAPRAVTAQEPHMRVVANRLIDEVLAAGTTCDFMADFAYRFPGHVFGSWLGLPDDRAEEYTALATAQVHYDPAADPGGEEFAAINARIISSLEELIEMRKVEPAEDIVSELLALDYQGRRLTNGELINITNLLFLAGFDTTAGAIGEVIGHLARYPEHRHLVREDPEALTRLIEECLRFYGNSGSSGRLVMRDVEIGGCPMKPGDKIFSSLQAANRDPGVFDRPDEMDISRWPNRHATFGMGVHRCLGSHVARAEVTTSVSEWLRRIPDFEIPDEVELQHNVSITTAFSVLPLVLHPVG